MKSHLIRWLRKDDHNVMILLISGVLVLILIPLMNDPANAQTGLNTEDLTGTLTPQDLVDELVGEGITVSNIVYTGADIAAGTFTGGTDIIGPDFDSGIILSTGDIADVIGPNESGNTTTTLGEDGDEDLNELAGETTYDATILEFDFVPSEELVSFQYVFASEEYQEFVYTSFNDVFGFFVNGENCALVDDEPVSINTINNGQPGDDTPPSNPDLYINNDDIDNPARNTEMDGLTVVLTCQAEVTQDEINHIKLAIADASDTMWDANVFLKAGSFITIESADLAVTKVDSADPVQSDEMLIYTLDVTNNGPDQATNIVLTDTLPAEFTALTFSLASCSGSSSIVCDLGTLNPDQSTTIVITGTAQGHSGGITNVVTVSATQVDPNPSNNTASETTTIQKNLSADLSVTKEGAPDEVADGETLVYTLEVTNNGPNPATNIVLTDTLPAEFIDPNFSEVGCSGSRNVVCNLGSLNPDQSTTFAITGTVQGAVDSILSTVIVSAAENDPNPTNNTASETTSIKPTSVELRWFRAKASGSYVTLEWQTDSEINSEGFNILRSGSESGAYFQINSTLIAAEGSLGVGAAYRFIDSDVVKGQTYWYKLEEVDSSAGLTHYGPVSATPSVVRSLYLPLIIKL